MNVINNTNASCSHLLSHIQSSDQLNELQRARSTLHKAQHRFNQCNICHIHTNMLYTCITCLFIGCDEHIRLHSQSSSTCHKFSIDLYEYEIYCIECSDIVYYDLTKTNALTISNPTVRGMQNLGNTCMLYQYNAVLSEPIVCCIIII